MNKLDKIICSQCDTCNTKEETLKPCKHRDKIKDQLKDYFKSLVPEKANLSTLRRRMEENFEPEDNIRIMINLALAEHGMIDQMHKAIGEAK